MHCPINERTGDNKESALIRALTWGSAKTTGRQFIDFLLSQPNIDVNIQDRDGRTALAEAESKRLTAVVQKLKDKGARAVAI